MRERTPRNLRPGAARTLPPTFGRLPADDSWKDVRAAMPARAVSPVPTVVVCTVPAEPILQRGAVGGVGGRRQ